MDYAVRITKEVESVAISQGADLVGVAPVARFNEAPEGCKPTNYLPSA